MHLFVHGVILINDNTGHFIMFCMITNVYNKKTKGPTVMELFTATGKLKKFFLTTRDVRCTQYVPPLPRDLAVILARITAAVKNIDEPMLTRVSRT
jgi:hypothetical protein